MDMSLEIPSGRLRNASLASSDKRPKGAVSFRGKFANMSKGAGEYVNNFESADSVTAGHMRTKRGLLTALCSTTM